jgi:hypothetical protein
MNTSLEQKIADLAAYLNELFCAYEEIPSQSLQDEIVLTELTLLKLQEQLQ